MITHSQPSIPPGSRSSKPTTRSSGLKVDSHIVNLALRRHWRWVFCLGLALASMGAVATYVLVKPKYQAAATIQIRSQVPYIAFEPDNSARDVSKRFVQTQIELLRSPIVLEPASGRPEIAAVTEMWEEFDPVKWMSQGLSVKTIGSSELLTVNFTSTSPKVSSTVVNAIIDEYFDIQKAGEATRNQRVIELLKDESARRQREILLMRNEIKQLVDKATANGTYLANTFTPNNTNTVPLLNPGSELLTRLTDAEVELEILQAQVQAEEKNPTNNLGFSQKELNTKIASHPEMQRLQEQLQRLQAELHETERVVAGGKSSPHCVRIINEIDRIKGIAKKFAGQLTESSQDEMKEEALRRHQDMLAQNRSKLESHRLMVNLLRERYAEQVSKLRKDNNGTLDIEFRRAELLRAESVLERISNRTVALRTEQRAPERIILRQRARPPLYPISSYPVKEILFVLFAGFAIPFGLAVLFEAARPKVNGGESLQRNIHINVLGEVARLPVRQVRVRGQGSLEFNRDLFLFEETVDALRTNLFLSERWSKSRVFAITSAVNSEGKTSIATQLALSVSRIKDVKTLLIDCDSRVPELHEHFDLSLSPGLTDVLTGESKPEETIMRTWLTNLDVLPAGELKVNPHSLFTPEAMERVLHWASSQYDYIILDTPPVLAASESLVAAKAADASIICAMQNVSRFDQVREACERLAVVGSPPIGAILSGVPYRSNKYLYGKYDISAVNNIVDTTT